MPNSSDFNTQRLRPTPSGTPRPVQDVGTTPDTIKITPPPLPGRFQVPGYEVMEEIGRGGTAVVYKARQIRLDRLVALKIIRDGEHASPDQRARFLAEAAAVARLHHPNIVQIHEIGEFDGRSFLALEYVEGGSLADQLRGTPLAATSAARLMLTLAQAVQTAHEQGIIHRDLKPANVLLAACGLASPPAKPQAALDPKITDFGLAKLLGHDSHLTETGEILGTPCFMAPEQARGHHDQVGPPADIYSLGAILYQLLTGRPPFVAESAVETLMLVWSDDPIPPRRLQPKLPRDLETICLKCLHKDPGRRYLQGADLAEDLQRFLDGQPILARATPLWERGLKWVRRRPAIAGLAAACVAVTIIGFALVSWQWLEAEAARDSAHELALAERQAREREAEQRWQVEAALDRAREDLYALHLTSAERAWLVNDSGRALQLLEGCPPNLRRWEWGFLRRTFEGSQLTFPGHHGPIHAVAFHSDGKQLASLGTDGFVNLWSLKGGLAEARVWVGPTTSTLCWGPDGQTWIVAGRTRGVRILNVAGKDLAHLGSDKEWPYALALSPDGKLLAGAIRQPDRDETPCPIVVWEIATGRERFRLEDHQGSVLGVAFSPDGQLLASSSTDHTAKIWSVESGQTLHTLRGHSDPVTSVSFATTKAGGDGIGKRLMATSSLDRTARIWDVDSGQELAQCRGHSAPIAQVALRGDGTRLATASWDGTVRIWDTKGQSLHLLKGHTSWLRTLAWSPDGQQLASGGDDGLVKVWDAAGPHPEALEIAADKDWIPAIAFDPNSQRIVSAGHKMVKTWDAGTGQNLGAFQAPTKDLRTIAFHPGGQWLAGGGGGGAWIWRLEKGEQPLHLQGHTDEVLALAWHPKGSSLATSSEDGTVRIWDAETGAQRHLLTGHTGPVPGVAFSPDGGRLASAGHDGTVRIWDVATGVEQRVFREHECKVECVAFHPDGRRLASGSTDRTQRNRPAKILIWDGQTGQVQAHLAAQGHSIWSLDFSPKGDRLATGSDHGGVTVWDVERGRELLSLRGHNDDVRCVRFSPDGRLLASSDDMGWVKVREGGR